MITQPKFSVVIPARNEEKVIARCLDSVEKQQGDFIFEVIVVNNGSSDKTKEISESYGVSVINETKDGVGMARKIGTEAANGEFIINMDADSCLPADYFSRVINIFKREPDLVCLGGQVFFYDAPWWLDILRFLSHRALYYYARVVSGGRVGPLGNNMVFRKSDYKKTAGFNADLKFGEDADINRKLSKFGKVKIDFDLKCFASSRRYHWKQKPFTQIINFLAVCRGLPLKNELPPAQD